MPPVSEQMALAGCQTNPTLTTARFLLKPGRKYEDAVEMFKPYAQVKEPNPDAKVASSALILLARATKNPSNTFMFVNNRLEGNALETIAAILEKLVEK